MSNCTYRFTGPDGKEVTIVGKAEMQAYMAANLDFFSAKGNFNFQGKSQLEVTAPEPAGAKAAPAEDLDAMFDEVLAEEVGAKQEKPKRKAVTVSKAGAGATAIVIDPSAMGGAPNPRTAGQAAASAAKNTAAGLGDTIAALGKLFGGGGKLSSGLTFDEQTYAKAKPLFKQAIAHFRDAGQDIKEAMRAVVRMVLDQFGAETAQNMKPYVVRFMEDVRDGKINYDEGKGGEDGSNDEQRGSTGEQGDAALGGVPAGEDGRPEGSGDARDAGEAGRGAGRGGNSGAGAKRGARGRGRGDGAAGVHPAEARAEDGVSPSEAPSAIPAANFRITEDVRLGKGGEIEKYNDNLRAIQIVKTLEAERRRATPEEQIALARYVGWGGLPSAFRNRTTGEVKKGWESRVDALEKLLTKDELDAARRSTMDAHYTAQPVVDAMWKAAQRLGFAGGIVLEPSVGVGNFIGLTPSQLEGKTRFVGVEYDGITARIARALYPQSSVLHSGFQDIPLQPDGFDLAIGNPPFGGQSLYFPYSENVNGMSIHNQFFVASMDAVKPGGLQIMVVSRYLMDAKDAKARRMLAEKAELLGAIRLPDSAFHENARTEVVTDILFLKKRTEQDAQEMQKAAVWINNPPSPGVMAREWTEDDRREHGRLTTRYVKQMSWVDTTEVADPLGGAPIEVSRYFAENPQMMLGSLERSSSMRYENDVTLRANPGEDIREALDTAISRLPELPPQHHDAVNASLMQFQAMREALEMSVNGEEEGAIKFDDDGNLVQVVSRESAGSADMLSRRVLTPDSPWSPQLQMDSEGRWFRVSPKLDEAGNKVKNGRFVVYDRETFASDKDVPDSLRLGAGKFERLKALAGLRDRLKKQLNLEAADEAADVMEENRAELDATYKAFVKAHGFINAGPNQALLSNMPDGPLVSALEMKYDPGVTAARARRTGQKVRKESAEPAPIMSQRVVMPYVPPNKAATGAEALTISLSETGRVDLERMSALLGKSEQAVIDELFTEAEAPLIFRDPESGEWQTRDAYLSGQVVKKLAAARDAGLEKNAAALEAVQPPPLSAADISVRLGQGWVPADIYAEFTQKIVGGKARVHFSKVMNQFDVRGEVSKAAQIQWGTEHASPLELISNMLNSQAVAVYKYVEEGGKQKRVLLEKETVEAVEKANEIANDFADWIMADADRRSRLAEIYNREFNNRVVRQYDGSHLILPGKVPDAVVKLRRHQKNVIWRGVSERFLLIDHAVGAGKAQPLDAKILTPKGWKRMGEIQPGDMVVSVDGTPTLVEAVFPQGEKEIFRVTFSDGSSTECCEEHLWLTSNYSERSQAGVAARRGKDWDCAKPKVRSLAEIRSTLKDERLGAKNHSIPIVAPVQFDSRAVHIDPYLLGVILGDGCISHDGIVITTPDVEIISKCESRLPGGVKLSRLNSAKQGACPSWSITADGNDRSKGCNPVKVALDELGLRGTHSHTKFIPDDYLFNSVDVRIELLRGLMDTDGSVMKSGKSTYFYSTSPMLKDGVVAIVQSLGGVVSVTEKRPTYTHNGEKRQGKLCYVLCIKMPASINPFSLPRKENAVVPKTSYAPTRYIVGVEPVGVKQAQCIRVAHPSHLYVTDDFIVTHNTFEAIARAMERRRMGLAKKPMIVVPNHMIEQFAADVYRLYPGARVLAAGKKDFETKKRRRLFSKIATGDWDIVVVPHSSFKFVGISPEREAQFIQEEIAAIEAGIKEAEAEDAGDGWRKPQSVKDGERLLERLNERMKRIKDIKRDNLLTFEQLGIDDMTIDEAHMFKNLAYYTRLTKVLGLGSKEGSERAWDLYNKVRVLRDSPRGAVTFMTGTPISNSIVEMYTMMRYLAMDDLADLGLEHFDAWHKQFAEAVTKFELNDANQLAEKTRLARWSNMPELMKLYYSFTDAVSLDDIKRWYAEDNGGKRFPVPAVKGGKRNNIIVQPTPAQEAVLEGVVREFNGLRGIKDPRERNAARLRLMDRARKVSLDARAVDPRIPTTEPGGKLEKVADEVARIYKEWTSDKGTQLVFLDRSVPKSKGDDKFLKLYDGLISRKEEALRAGDEDLYDSVQEELDKFNPAEVQAVREAQSGGWNAYEQIKRNLMARGIPENEIRFIQEANTDDQKQQLFDAVKSGEVRILLGSTERMGAGTNVQDRLVALHHVDVNWKPSDIEQREGRIVRQGNLLLEKYGEEFEVEINAYATKRTYDAKMWSLNEAKGRFINGLRSYNGEREVEIDDSESENMAEMAAMASGDPRMLERVQLDAEVKKLEMSRRAFNRRKLSLEDSIQRAERNIATLPTKIEGAKQDQKRVNDAIEEAEQELAARRVDIEGEEFNSEFEAQRKARELIDAQKGDNARAKFTLMVNGRPYTSVDAVEKAIRGSLGDSAAFPFVSADGERFSRRSVAGSAIASRMNDMRAEGKEEEVIGTYYGMELRAFVSQDDGVVVGTLLAKGQSLKEARDIALSDMLQFGAEGIQGSMARLASDIRGAVDVSSMQRQLKEAQETLPVLKGQFEKPFAQAEEYEKKKVRLGELTAELAAEGKDNSPTALMRGEAGDGAISRDEAEQIINEFRKQYPAAPMTMLIESFDDLPVKAKEEAEMQGGNASNTFGAMHQGAMYLIRNNLADRDALETAIFHELVGHFGLRNLLGPDFVRKTNQLYAQLGGVDGLRRLAEKEGFTAQFNDYAKNLVGAYQKNPEVFTEEFVKMLLTEEAFAHIAQNRPTLATHIKALVGMIREFLRGLGFFKGKELNQYDVAHILAQVRRKLSTGGVTLVGGDQKPMAKMQGRETINVDGVERPTANSKGQPIHPTEEGLRSFWRWFGGSKAVDEKGRPLVVNHGTPEKGITEFDPEESSDIANGGIWFTDDQRQAGRYADPDNRGRGEIVEAFVSLQNPLIVDAMQEAENAAEMIGEPPPSNWDEAAELLQYGDWSRDLVDQARAGGYDGLIIKNVGDADTVVKYLAAHVVAFRPEQIKSATGNTGAFDPSNPSILASRQADRTAETPASIRSALVERFGEDGISALENSGLLKIVPSMDAVPAGVRIDGAEAVYDPAAGVAYLVADRMSANRAAAALLHELGEHHGLEGFIGKPAWMLLKTRVSAMAQRAGSYASGAWAGVKATYPEFEGMADADLTKNDRFIHEVLAKIGESGSERASSLWRDLMAAIKRGMLRLGFSFQINEDDVRDLVAGSLRRLMRGGDGGPRGGVQANSDAGAPMASMAANAADFIRSPEAGQQIRNKISDLFRSGRTFNVLHRTVGTQYHKAKVDPEHFGRVFNMAQQYIDDISRTANEAADTAPDLLPKMERMSDAFKQLWHARADSKDAQALAAPIFEGTMNDKVWSADELRQRFNLDDRQIGLYQQFRAAVDRSLDELALSEMSRTAKMAKLEAAPREMNLRDALAFYMEQIAPDIERLQGELADTKERQQFERDQLEEAAQNGDSGADERRRYADLRESMNARHAAESAALKARIDDMAELLKATQGKVEQIEHLKATGYAPLMRFGQYTVDVFEAGEDGKPLKNADGEEIRHFFGMFESEAEANEAARALREEYPNAAINQGVMSQDSFRLFRGVTPETVEVFARMMGEEQSEVFQKYLKQAVNNRSALKRLIQRKGIAGFEKDPVRVLATFLTSNARATAANYHFGDMLRAASEIPKEKGDVKDEAIKLIDYIQNPGDEAASLRGLLFMHFLGGSVASAMVNMTQTFTMTLPYLAQFGGDVTGNLKEAMGIASRRLFNKNAEVPEELKMALQRASDEGVVSPHEIHMLQGESMRTGWFQNNRYMRALGKVWGSFFSLAEHFNRDVAFIAAYRSALARNLSDEQAYEFAKDAVRETQGVYSRANKANWARGAVGATIFTFKQFSISYLEFLKRLPPRERAIALAVLWAFAGMSGMPFSDDLDDIIDTIAHMLGFAWDNKAKKRAFVANVFGKDASEYIMNGVSAGLPLDISGRMGMANLIPGTGVLDPSKDRAKELTEIAGPAGSAIQTLVKAGDRMLNGIGSARDVRDIAAMAAPIAISNLMKGWDMAEEGFYSDSRGRKVVETDMVDAFGKSLGFNPSVVAESSRAREEIFNRSAVVRDVKNRISERWALGIAHGRPEQVREAREVLARWNENNPDDPIRVNMSGILRRAKEARATAADRAIKATPKELRDTARMIVDGSD